MAKPAHRAGFLLSRSIQMETYQAWKDQEHDQIPDDLVMEQNSLRTKPISNRSRRWMKILISFASFCLLVSLFRERLLLLIGDFLIVEDTLQPADVIHVIAGDDYRTEYAIQLYKEGYGKTLFFTGGWCTFHNYYHGKHAEELSLAQGIPVQAIAYDESRVTSTYMEVERLKEWISQQPEPVRSVIMVSDPFHMRRAQWTYRRVFGGSVAVQMAPVPFENTPHKHLWWRDELSQKYVKDEYPKLAYYLLRYGLSWKWLSNWLASLDKE